MFNCRYDTSLLIRTVFLLYYEQFQCFSLAQLTDLASLIYSLLVFHDISYVVTFLLSAGVGCLCSAQLCECVCANACQGWQGQCNWDLHCIAS